jgi:hypothetical protein
MDFKMISEKNGTAKMSWDKNDNITGNIYFSLNIIPGTIFNNPDFGLLLSDILKVTVNNIALIKQRIKKSLQWILDINKAKSIDIIVERDLGNINRVNIKIEALQADGLFIEYSQFKTVG